MFDGQSQPLLLPIGYIRDPEPTACEFDETRRGWGTFGMAGIFI